MPDVDNSVATLPTQDAPSGSPTTDSGAAPGTPTQSTTDEPFLKVSDRQVYKTREEATRAYSEASNRIAELSPWDQLRKEGFTPQQISEYLNELADRRAKETAATQSAQPTTPKLTPEWQAHIDFLKSQGIFTTMDELKALREQVQQYGSQIQGEQAARIEAARSNGELALDAAIKSANLTLNDDQKQFVHDSIEDNIIRSSRDERGNLIPNSPEDRFIRGDAAERSAIVNNGLKRFLDFGDLYAKRQTAAFVDQKAAASAASPRPLPASTSAIPIPAKPGLGFKDRDLNSRVQAAMEAERARRGGGDLL